ncbi:MAG: hypothetical protein R2822_25735 [Spirosomataceae bacterium]
MSSGGTKKQCIKSAIYLEDTTYAEAAFEFTPIFYGSCGWPKEATPQSLGTQELVNYLIIGLLIFCGFSSTNYSDTGLNASGWKISCSPKYRG